MSYFLIELLKQFQSSKKDQSSIIDEEESQDIVSTHQPHNLDQFNQIKAQAYA